MPLPIATLEKELQARLNLGLTLRWFKNNFTPTPTSVVADFTEADFSGYAAKPLTYANWDFTAGDPTIAEYPAQVVTADANGQNQTVYGIYITYDSDGTLAWYEKFPTERLIDANGDSSSYVARRVSGNAGI